MDFLLTILYAPNMKTVTWQLIFRWQDWIAFEELHRPLFREHGAIYFSNVNKPSKDMNYAFCEVCSLFSPLEWPFLQPNSPQFRDSLTHFRQPSFECVLLAVSSHPLCYLGYTQEGDSNVQRQDPPCIEVTKLSFSYSWDVLNFLSSMKCYF